MNRVETTRPAAQRSEPADTTAPPAKSATDASWLIPSLKVKDWHLQRKGIVYIRQSTPQQIVEHRESTDRQYALVHRATALGWCKDRVEVVDEDQGRSGQSAE